MLVFGTAEDRVHLCEARCTAHCVSALDGMWCRRLKQQGFSKGLKCSKTFRIAGKKAESIPISMETRIKEERMI